MLVGVNDGDNTRPVDTVKSPPTEHLLCRLLGYSRYVDMCIEAQS